MDKVRNHHWPLAVVVPFTHSDLTTATAEATTQLPPKATITGGSIVIDTAFDYATSGVIDIGDAADPNRYTSSAVDLTTAARTALTLTGYQTTAPTDITATPTLVGAVSAGAGRLIIEYVVEGKGNENSR